MDTTAYNALAGFLKARSGIALAADKTYLVQSRLQPVATSAGFASIEALIFAVAKGGVRDLERQVVEAMTTNETSFFRDAHPFNLFRSAVLPYLLSQRRNRKSLRILCAAASSGQEPYSLAMLLREERARLEGWRTEIVGVDIDQAILNKAQAGVYSSFEVQRGTPVTFLNRYFSQENEGQWRLKNEVRDMVQFRTFNLMDSMVPLGQFDVVFCRNVLIYFDEATKADVLKRLSQQMSDDGFLFLGGAETVLGITDRFRPIAGKRGVYVKMSQPAGQELSAAA